MQHNFSSAAMNRPPERFHAAPASRPFAALLMHPAAKPLLFLMCLLPLLWLLHQSYVGSLGDYPVKALIQQTGSWALYFLYFTLCITPLRQLTGQAAWVRFRRTLGLFSFFYAVLHFVCYSWLDMGFNAQAIIHDIQKRPAAMAGVLALLLLLPMAATASNSAIKALTVKRWQTLHKAIYVIVVLGVLHFLLVRLGKGDLVEVGINATIVALLLGWRIWHWFKHRLLANSKKSNENRQIAPEVYAFLEAIDQRQSRPGSRRKDIIY
jgi:methionine sulfoxide reductase heme-binding subunit